MSYGSNITDAMRYNPLTSNVATNLLLSASRSIPTKGKLDEASLPNVKIPNQAGRKEMRW